MKPGAGNRKLVALAMGLAYLLALVVAVGRAGLPVEALTPLCWAGFGLVSAVVGGNSVEHAAHAAPAVAEVLRGQPPQAGGGTP